MLGDGELRAPDRLHRRLLARGGRHRRASRPSTSASCAAAATTSRRSAGSPRRWSGATELAHVAEHPARRGRRRRSASARVVVLGGAEGDSSAARRRGARRPARRRAPGRRAPSSAARPSAASACWSRSSTATTDPWLTRAAARRRQPRRGAAARPRARPSARSCCEHALRAGSRIERRVVSMLERSASYAALALHNAWLLEQVQRLAATDGLTGIANRAHVRATPRARGRPRDPQRRAAVSLRDARHRPLQAAQRHARPPGRRRGAAQRRRGAAASAATLDTAARYGGEEFAVMLPGSDRGRGARSRRADAQGRRRPGRSRRR